MISRLEIKGFKSLVDVSIELGAVNVFIGANGCGKSNLLEAVGFLSALVQGGLESESIRYRGVRQGTPLSFCTSLKEVAVERTSLLAKGESLEYSVNFAPSNIRASRWSITNETGSVNGVKFFDGTDDRITVYPEGGSPIELTVNNLSQRSSSAGYALAISSATSSETKERYKPYGSKPVSVEDIPPPPGPTLFDKLRNFAVFTPTTGQLRGLRYDVQRVPVGLEGSGLDQAIADMLRIEQGKLGPFDLGDVYELIEWADSLKIDAHDGNGSDSIIAGGTVRLRIGDRFMREPHKSVSLLEASEGALYVLFMLALVGHEDSPKIFAVDNFDQALHPRLACALTRLISDQILVDGSRQMLATTHNPLVLDGLNLLDDRIRLFAVDRDPAGATQICRIEVSEELMAQADKGLSLSRLWLMGRLGGVPKYL